MTSVFSYLVTMIAILFWMFRVFITVVSSMGSGAPIQPINMTYEIIVLFITLFCFIFIIKRNIFGALLYFITYGLYFGTYVYENLVENTGSIDYLSLAVAVIGIAISAFTLLDILLNKDRALGNGDKKTDWFYKGTEFDVDKDNRTDDNQYKFY